MTDKNDFIEDQHIRGRLWRGEVLTGAGEPRAVVSCYRTEPGIPGGELMAYVKYASFVDLFNAADALINSGHREVGELMLRTCDALFRAMRDRVAA